MKSLRTKTSRRMSRSSGFSLLEMMMVVALLMIVSAITFMSLQPVLQQQRVVNAYNTTLAALREGRDYAVAQRVSYVVFMDTTTTPHSITVAPTFNGFTGALPTHTYQLPNDVKFVAVAGIPTSNAKTPDRFGVGATAVDFGYTGQGTGVGGQNRVYFCPDGSAQDAAGGIGQCAGNPSDGVVYIARPTDLYSSRAITIWGATGRIRGWRLFNQGGKIWLRQ